MKTPKRGSAMVDNIKLDKILPSLSPTRKVQRTDPKGRNNQQTPFRENLARKQKKKEKDDPEQVRVSERNMSIRAVPRNRQADRKGADKSGQSRPSSQTRLIDIRV